jgi:predicted TIM-barrel fold metal-dependent hydrolase
MTLIKTVVRGLISADSHVIEPISVWDGLLPDGFWADESSTFSERPGGYDPSARTKEMEVDGVSAEVLYPSLGLRLFGLMDRDLQARAFRQYNEWLARYCEASPDRLIGVGLVSAFDMESAVREVSWCKEHGLRGIEIWQVPPPQLAFSSRHYEPLWEACSSLTMPVSLHILTGFGYALDVFRYGSRVMAMDYLSYKISIAQKLMAVQDAVLEIILSGAPDRYRDLRFILVENECSWIPFFLDQFDYYYERFEHRNPIHLERTPSQVFSEQFLATFFRDPNTALCVDRIGTANLMWSSDYPHGNSTWPRSQEVVQELLGGLLEPAIHELVWGNVAGLFGIDLLESPAAAAPSVSG